MNRFNFDAGHLGILISTFVALIGPLVIANLTASEVSTVSLVVQAIIVVLTTVLALLKRSVVQQTPGIPVARVVVAPEPLPSRIDTLPEVPSVIITEKAKS